MARISKYEMLVGKVVNGIYVSDYKRVTKISKTGRKYYRYEVQVDNVLWISTTSWNKQTFYKRLNKIKQQTPIKKMYEIALIDKVMAHLEKECVDEDINKIKTIYNLQELKSFYRKLSKKLHPDMGGDSNLFAKAHEFYENRKEAIKITLEDDDYNTPNFKELVNIMEEMIEFSKQTGDYYKQN